MTTNKRQAEIIDFGKIEENERGTLCILNFNINLGDEFKCSDEAVVTLCIRRLQAELDQLLKQDKPKPIYYVTDQD